MLQFITGGAGTGKSTRIGEEMRRLRQAGKTVYYLVPEQYSFEMERRYYADDILVYSMERLADAIFRRCGGLAGAYASDTVQLMLMRETLRDVGSGLSLLQKSAGKPGFAAGMLSLRAELMRAGVDAGALEEAARSLRPAAGEGDALPLKLRDLALIFEGYGAALSRSFLDPSARLSRAVEKAAENGSSTGPMSLSTSTRASPASSFRCSRSSSARRNRSPSPSATTPHARGTPSLKGCGRPPGS